MRIVQSKERRPVHLITSRFDLWLDRKYKAKYKAFTPRSSMKWQRLVCKLESSDMFIGWVLQVNVEVKNALESPLQYPVQVEYTAHPRRDCSTSTFMIIFNAIHELNEELSGRAQGSNAVY